MEKILKTIYDIYTDPEVNIIVFMVILLFTFLISPLLSKLIAILFGYKGKMKKCKFYEPLKTVFYLLGTYVAIYYLKLSEDAFNVLSKIIEITLIFAVALVLVNIIGADTGIFKNVNKKIKANGNLTLARFLTNVLKVIVIVIAIFTAISELGYNINGILASLGIGGAIVALAAQDWAKNFFGGFAIIMDKPFKVGDWIETNECAGTVQDINLRSTRIRQFDQTLVTIPNSILSNEKIINWGGLEKRRYITEIVLQLETPLDKLNEFIENAYATLEVMPTVVENGLNINFDEIKDYGFKIYIYIDTTTIPYREYLKFKEMVNYKLKDLIDKTNIKLAYPTQTINVKK